MTLRYVHSILAVAVLTCGVTVGVAYAQQRDGGLLPANQSGTVTVTGCLVRGDQIRGGDPDKFVLANPTAPIANAPAETCTAESGANAVQLDNPKKGPIDESMLGRWVQISEWSLCRKPRVTVPRSRCSVCWRLPGVSFSAQCRTPARIGRIPLPTPNSQRLGIGSWKLAVGTRIYRFS